MNVWNDGALKVADAPPTLSLAPALSFSTPTDRATHLDAEEVRDLVDVLLEWLEARGR